MSFELLDIGLYYAEKGVNTVKSYPLYQRLDAQVGLDDKFALVLNASQTLYTRLGEKMSPLVENVFFLYDQSRNTITSYIKVITSKQTEITEYVNNKYSTAQV